MKRVFLIVLDSFGIGGAVDAQQFGDPGTNTLLSVSQSPCLNIPYFVGAGMGNIDGVTALPKTDAPTAAYARLEEVSQGKDTTIGHWEIAGVVSNKPLPTYPNGFPKELLDAFSRETGRGVLCNLPYSGTAVIDEYGAEHVKTGDLIVYTSADSVFQIAAHEELVPPETLYEYCRIARRLLTGDHAVGRVIARPFVGDVENGFKRTANRRDFSLEPPKKTLLDYISEAGLDVISVGKISDIFAGQGVTEAYISHSNTEGMEITASIADKDFHGLCFTNLVDFDMLYGHRRDVDGYARALSQVDAWLPGFLAKLGDEDVLMITADHGCDPAYTATTDHTRENTPWMIFGKKIIPGSLGTMQGFSNIAATIADMLGVPYGGAGDSQKGKLEA